MSHLLRANTAVDVLIGPFVDSTDGNTDETGLTISQADIRLSKNGQNMAQKNDANAATHDELGYYNCPLDATDTNTEGQLDIIVHESGALHAKTECEVLAEAAWDSLFAPKDTGYMDVNIKAVSEDTTAADNLESACDNYSVTRGLTGTALPAAVADEAGGLPISDAGGLDLDTQLANTNEITAARMGALTDWIDGGRLDLIIDAILTDTGTTLDGKIDTIDTNVDAILVDTGTTLDGKIDTIDTNVDTILVDTADMQPRVVAIEADTNELQGDWANGGRLDLILDIIAADTTTDIPALIGTAQADLDIITGAAGVVIADGALTAAKFGADCITAAKVAADVHTEGATAVWSSSNATLSKAYSLIMEQIYQFLCNDMNITDATGAVALRNLANNADMATWGITDNDTTTARTDVVWS